MTTAHKVRKRQRAMAARQALSLCEAELRARHGDAVGQHIGASFGRGQPRLSVVTARTALRAAGLPPHLAAELRSRLRLALEMEGE